MWLNHRPVNDGDQEGEGKVVLASVVSKDRIGKGIFRRRCLQRRPFLVRPRSRSSTPFSPLIGGGRVN